MPPVLAVLFWIWLAASIVFFVRRRAARTGAAEVTADAVEATQAPVPEEALIAAVDFHDALGDEVLAPDPLSVAAAPVSPMAAMAPAAAAPLEDRRMARRVVPAAGVAEALVGIRMPCDLVPLVVDRLSTGRIALSTTGYPAEVVGTALADELERLGYVLRPLTDVDLIATRGATELHLRIEQANIDGRHLDHPTAREDSVVVEIELRLASC